MSNVTGNLAQTLRSVASAIARLLPFKSSQSATPDPLADKLKGIRHEELDGEETTRRQEGQGGDRDGLAEIIYRARPQNPFDKDF